MFISSHELNMFLQPAKLSDSVAFLSSNNQAKIPDIEKCLDIVATLQAKKGTGEVRYSFYNDLL